MTADTTQSDREIVMLLTSEAHLRQRISPSALGHYFEVVRREVAQFFQQHTLPWGFDLQVAIAVFPDRKPLIDVQGKPPLPYPTGDLLVSCLESVEVPAVWNGPAAFAFRQMINGGGNDVAPQFPFPFLRRWQLYPEGVDVDDFIRQCAEERKQERSGFWERSKQIAFRLLQSWFPVQRWLPAKWAEQLHQIWGPLPTVVEVLPALPDEPEEEVVVPDLSLMPLDQLEQLISAFPNEVQHYWRRIQVRVHAGSNDHGAIIQDCKEALRIEPNHPWTLLMLSCSQRALDDSAAALLILNGLIQTHPRIVEGYVFRSEIYAEIGAYEAMFADLEQALRLSPRSASLLMRHARACSALDRHEAAYRDLAILQRLDPHDSRIFALRAYIRRRSSGDSNLEEQNRALAQADVERALKIDPKCADAYAIRAEIKISLSQFAEAIADCNRALECDAHYIDAFAFRGLAQFRQQQLEGAEADLAAAIEKGCLLNFVRPLLAEVQLLRGDHDAAIQTLDAILEYAPEDPQALMQKAVLLLNTDRPQGALELLNDVLKKHPDLAVAYAERGKVRRALEEFEGALEDFATALQLGATESVVVLNRAATLLDLNRFEEAVDEFTAGLNQEPESALGHFYRGCAFQSLKRNEEALADFTTAIRLNPEFSDAYFRRALTLMSCEQFNAAIGDFTELVQRTSHAKFYAGRGQARILAGQLEQADEDFQEAIQLSPGDAEDFRMVQLLSEAQYHLRHEAYDDAILRASEALEIDGQCVPALMERAGARWYGNQFVEAIEDYSSAMEITGPNAAALSGRGQIYAELGEYELALLDLDEALDLCEDHDDDLRAYLQNGRGLALTGLDRYEEATAAFERSIVGRPGNAWVHYNHGLLYVAQGQTPSAVLCFQLALRLTEPALRTGQRARALGFLNRQEQKG